MAEKANLPRGWREEGRGIRGGERSVECQALSAAPAMNPAEVAAMSLIPQAEAPMAAAKAERMVMASRIQKFRLRLFLSIAIGVL